MDEELKEETLAEKNVCRDACEANFQNLGKLVEEAKPHPPSILTVPVFGTSVKNMPHNILESELNRKLKASFPEILNHTNMVCRKYTYRKERKKQLTTIAVISGARGELRDLQRQAFNNPLKFGCHTFNYVFLPDFEVPRSTTGERLDPVNGTAYHTIKEREGPLKRNGIRLFSDEFRASLPEEILNLRGSTTLCVIHSTLGLDDLPCQESYQVERVNKGSQRRIESSSLLEAIQLIRKINSAPVRGQGVIFQNNDWTVQSTCRDLKGLGVKGSLIKFDVFTHAIPLSWIDLTILNAKFIQSFSLTCFRCEKPYVLVATSINLDYLLASCCCTGPFLSYEAWNSQQVPIDSPYHHPGEVLTRLSYFTTDDKQQNKILIAFPYLTKMDIYYPSAQMMCNILLHILEEEWRSIRDFSHRKDCSAIVEQMEKLGMVDKTNERVILHLVVQKTNFWRVAKSSGFKNATIQCDVRVQWKQDHFKTNVSGDLRKATQIDSEQLRLLYEVEWQTSYVMIGKQVKLTPNADKSEYLFSRKYLKNLPTRFTDQDFSSTILSGLFIKNYTMPPDVHQPSIADQDIIDKILKNLNLEQAEAFRTALRYRTSVIQGPPGTGKSHLISLIALALAQDSPGVILCTAASNIACDVMYRKIVKNSKAFGINVNVCRVFSRGRELLLRANAKDHENSWEDSPTEEPMRTLHNLVAADSRYLSGRSFGDIRNLFETGNEYKMTRAQQLVFRDHVCEIEREILTREKIIVITNGCLASFRLGKAKHGKNNEEVNFVPIHKDISVLVDEAGVQSVTSILPLESLKPVKIVMIGDHKQLQPHVISRPAEEAGLNRSLMEWLVQDRKKCPVPMTMLLEQFRAHRDLRTFTSHLSYDDKLRDADSIATRKEIVQKKLLHAFPLLKLNRIWVKSHDGKEIEADCSKANNSEANIVLDTVDDFLQKDLLLPSDIVVLTPYDGQKLLILRLLKLKGYGNVSVKSVDEYQGNEATCVIVSFTRSNNIDNIGFLMTANRVNVCISRAREVMVLCINLRMIEKYQYANSHLGKMYRFLKQKCLVTDIRVPSEERVPEKYISNEIGEE